jgi:hypothetical protein
MDPCKFTCFEATLEFGSILRSRSIPVHVSSKRRTTLRMLCRFALGGRTDPELLENGLIPPI